MVRESTGMVMGLSGVKVAIQKRKELFPLQVMQMPRRLSPGYTSKTLGMVPSKLSILRSRGCVNRSLCGSGSDKRSSRDATQTCR